MFSTHRYFISSLSVLLLTITQVVNASCLPFTKECIVEFWSGYRSDELKWNLGDTAPPPPDIRHEINWEGIKIWQIGLNQRYVGCNHLYFRASESYGWIFDGHANQSTYFDSSEEFQAKYKSSSGSVYDFTGGLGIQFNFCQTFSISPLIGFSYNAQKYELDHGQQQFPSGLSTELITKDSKYYSHWYGPWIGCDFQYTFNDRYNLISECEYHWGQFRADGNFGLSTLDDQSFKEKANGNGYSLSLEANYMFCNCWKAGLKGKYQEWQTRSNGNDTRAIINGTGFTTETIALNKVKWESWSITASIGRNF